MFILTLIITPIFQGLGFFFVALERQFGWSRTVLSLPFSLGRVEGALIGPLEGYLTDRLGSRRMILIGFVILGGGFVAFSFIQGVVGFFVTFLVIFAGAGLGGFIPLMAALNHWFVRHRAKAMGIGLVGASLGALLAPLLGQAIEDFGWRAVALWLGIAVLALAIPMASVVRNRPEEYGQRPDGDPPPDPTTTEASVDETALEDEANFTVGEALRTPAFWAIAFAHGFSAASAVAIAVHIVPAMTDIGMSLPMAGTVVLTYGASGAIFQLLGGFLGDRVPKPPAIAAFVVVQGIGMLVAATIHTVPGAFLFAVLFGAGLGGRAPLLTAIRGDYFGRRDFATILGVSQVPMNLVMMFAPIAAGYFFDTLGSYTVPFLGLAVLNFLGAAFMLMARKPVLPASRQGKTTVQPTA
jgi:MFS family permease